MHKVYEYNSCFSKLITQHIFERRNSGFTFDNQAYWLYRFDQYCLDNKIQEVSISKKLYQEWASISDSETKVTQNNRLQALRGFSVYLNTIFQKQKKISLTLWKIPTYLHFLSKLTFIIRTRLLIRLTEWRQNIKYCFG